jgi:hypothetical protein
MLGLIATGGEATPPHIEAKAGRRSTFTALAD